MATLLSVIIPVYNEEGNIKMAFQKIDHILKNADIRYELLFINDGSQDTTWDKINEMVTENKNIRGLCFSRNFGKEAAIFAGLEYSKGDCCVVIDCDLQHPPEKIVDMYRLWEAGYEVVEARKKSRGDESIFHSLAAKCFYSIISKGMKIDMSRSSDFKLLDRKAVMALVNMKEQNVFFRALSSWIGFKTAQVEFDVQDRMVGESKWSTIQLIKYAIANISAFSAAPMQLVTFLGIFMLGGSIILGIMALYDKLTGVAPEGFTTVLIIQLFMGSIIMISLGIIGYYISKIYEETKRRPRYIVTEICKEK